MPSTHRATRKEWVGLAVLALPTLLLSFDLSVLYLALPQLTQDLGADSTEQLWITDIYGFLIAGFLVTMGTLGDRIGRRKLLLVGGTAFGIASVIAAYSSSTEMLIAMRAVMGIAGATLMPSTLALISNMFRDEHQRGVAIAVWMTCFMGGMMVGPIIGGVLLENFWWGSAFLLGVPVMAILAIAGPRLLPEYKNENAAKLDLISVALSLLAILPMIYGLKETAKYGVEPIAVAALIFGVCVGYVFTVRQRTLQHPLVDITLFHARRFRGAIALMVVTAFIMGGTFFIVSQSLQTVWDLSPLEAGLALIPQAILMSTVSMLSPVLAKRYDPAKIVGIGMVVTAVGFAMLAFVDATSNYFVMIAAFSVITAGVGTTPLLSNIIIGSAPPERAGSAASVQEASGEFGIALGVAAIGSLSTAVYRSTLADNAPAGTAVDQLEVARESIVSAVAVGGNLLDPARDAFIAGLSVTSVAAAVASVALAWVAFRTLGKSSADISASPARETVSQG